MANTYTASPEIMSYGNWRLYNIAFSQDGAAAAETVVAAVAGKRIRLLGGWIITAAGGTLQFFSNSTALMGQQTYGAEGGLLEVPVVNGSQPPLGLVQTAAGEALKVTTSAPYNGVLKVAVEF